MNQVTLFRDNETGLDFAAELGEVTPVSWQPPAELTFEEWTAIGNTLQQVGASLNWWIGDWLNYGERKWGEMYAQAVEVTGWDYQRLADTKYVALHVEFSFRNENLSWTHHRHVASLPPEEQAEWLELAAANGWRSGQLKDAIKASKQLPPILPLPEQPHVNGNGYHAAADIADPDDVPFATLPQVQQEESDADPFQICDVCGKFYDAAAISYCPYCNLSATARIEYIQQTERVPHVSHNSGNNEWYTPAEYIQAARRVMGYIDLDPASSEAANEVVGAIAYYTAEDDGLSLPWVGKVWMNPPYAKALVEQFADKMAYHVGNGDVTEAIVLVNNATETAWFRKLIGVAAAVAFPASRVKFWQPNSEPGAPLQGQACIYIGHAPDLFLSEFTAFGWGATL